MDKSVKGPWWQGFYRVVLDWYQKYHRVFYYGSTENVWKIIFKCPFGFHEGYPESYYQSCWVCGKKMSQ